MSLADFTKEVQATPDRNHGVDVEGPLEWRKPIKDDPLSLQGIISAAVLGNWYAENPRRLFDDNVRLAKESDVNEEIVQCLLEEPQYFLHFNLGINALCESWSRASEDVGPVEHHFKKLRIVNGAQTVYSIHKAMAIDRESVENAQVLIRFTRLDKAPLGFGARVARATNRSNPMSARDRLAMDPTQQRLRGEFTLNLGRDYVIRAGDTVPAQEKGCSVQEAAIAMACGRYAAAPLIQVTEDTASLWTTQGDAYRNSSPRISRRPRSGGGYRPCASSPRPSTRSPLPPPSAPNPWPSSAGLIIAHLVMRRLGDDGIDDIASDWDSRLANVPRHAHAALRDLAASVEKSPRRRPRPRRASCAWPVPCMTASGWPRRSSASLHLTIGIDGRHGALGPVALNTGVPTAPRDRARGAGSPVRRRVPGERRSMAGLSRGRSLQTTQLHHRQNLRDSLARVPAGRYLRLTRDALFESPSQAAAVMTATRRTAPPVDRPRRPLSDNQRLP